MGRTGAGTPPFDTGLEHRLRRAARQMVDQHRHLGPIRQELKATLENGSGLEPAQSAFRNYAQALDAHFRLEDEVFFPALHGLHPEFTKELQALERDHVELVRRLEALGERIRSDAAAASEALRAFHAELAQHERREESLVERIVAAGTSLGLDAPDA